MPYAVKSSAMGSLMKIRVILIGIILLAGGAISFAQPNSDRPDPQAILKDLYKRHDAKEGPFFNRKNRKLLEQYFNEELAALILKNAEAADRGSGALNFDPLYASPDPRITEFKIGDVRLRENASDEEGRADVEVTFKDSGKPVTIEFYFVQDASKAWKIGDIDYPDGHCILVVLDDD